MGHSSAIDDSELPPERMIPGIYNYCDRWCERCAFSRRCRVFRDVRVMEHAFERGQNRVQTLADLAVAECQEAERERSPAARVEWDGEETPGARCDGMGFGVTLSQGIIVT